MKPPPKSTFNRRYPEICLDDLPSRDKLCYWYSIGVLLAVNLEAIC